MGLTEQEQAEWRRAIGAAGTYTGTVDTDERHHLDETAIAVRCRVLLAVDAELAALRQRAEAAEQLIRETEALLAAWRLAVGVKPDCPLCHGKGGNWWGDASSCEAWHPCSCWTLIEDQQALRLAAERGLANERSRASAAVTRADEAEQAATSAKKALKEWHAAALLAEEAQDSAERALAAATPTAQESGDLDALQASIGAWADTTFRGRPTIAILRHLQREAKELLEAAERGDPGEEETADVLILALNWAAQNGFSALGAVRHKLAINRGRRWGQPDAEGVREHVRETLSGQAPAGGKDKEGELGMAYIRGEWYVYAMKTEDGMGYLQMHGEDGRHFLMPLAVFDQLVMMRHAEMTDEERATASRTALATYGSNLGALPLQAAVEGRTVEEVMASWMGGVPQAMRTPADEEDTEPIAICADCGDALQLVRPGKYQCDNCER